MPINSAMSSTMKIYCKNIEEYVDIKGGESLLQLAEALSERLGGMSPICASVNNKTEPLQYQVFAPKQVEFLDRRSASGERVYIRSLCMMLYCAVRQELPDVRLRIEHSIAGGYYCRQYLRRVRPSRNGRNHRATPRRHALSAATRRGL